MAVTSEARDDLKLDLAAEVLRAGGRLRLQALGNSMLRSDLARRCSLHREQARAKRSFWETLCWWRGMGGFLSICLMEKCESGWVTRGDSLPQNDPPAEEIQVLGKVATIHRKGRTVCPNGRVSPLAAVFAGMLCRLDLLRNLALRMHLLWDRRAYQ